MRVVNKKFNHASKSEWLWRQKFTQHFGCDHGTNNSYEVFKQKYKEQYKDLSDIERKIVSLTLVNDAEAIMKFKLDSFKTIYRLFIKYAFSTWSQFNQALLDYLYHLAHNYFKKDINAFNYYQENYFEIDYTKTDNYELTILHHAIQSNQPLKTIVSLIEHGCDVKAKTPTGRTPLWYAATEGRIDIVELLLKYTVNINDKAQDGSSPLTQAAFNGYSHIVKLLLEHGADVNCCDANNGTALFAASQNGHLKIVTLLKNNRARDDIFFMRDKNQLLKVAQSKSKDVYFRMALLISAKNKSDDINPMIKISPLEIAQVMGHTEIVNELSPNKNKTEVLRRSFK